MQKLKVALAGAALLLAVGGTASADTSLAVVPGCAQGGSNFGLQVTYDGTNTNAFLIDESPTNETRHIVSIVLRVANGTMAIGDNHQFIRARDPGGSGTVWRLHLRRVTDVAPGCPPAWGACYVATLWIDLDVGSMFVGERLLRQGFWQLITVDWMASSSAGAGDGVASIQKGAGAPKTATNLDNFFVVNQEQLGAFAGIDPGTIGTVCYDNFSARRAP